MTELKTNFNVAPYYDDYDADKQFTRVLFRPATAVQARELTQIQTILQEQIKRFGSHIFKDGSIIDGVAVTYHPNIPVAYLENTFTTNTEIVISDIDSSYLLYANTGVRAQVKAAKQGFVSQYPSTNRFYLDYLTAGKDGSNNDIFEFQSGDVLYMYNSDQSKLGTLVANNLVDTINVFTTNATANATGYGYAVSVSDGIIFQKGFFSKVAAQTLVVKDHDTNPNNYVVGFDTTESIVTEAADTSLFDNSNGSSNENAPGAHRLKLAPTLVAKLRTETANNTNFFAIIEFDNDQPSEQNDDPVYNKLGEEFARRTSEESGDYIVKPFTLETLTHASNSSLMNFEVSPGIGYVKGNRVELIGAKRIEVERGLDTQEALNQIVSANYGNYVIVDEALGVFDFDKLQEVTFYDTAQNAVTEYEGADAAPSGNVVGYANIRGLQHNSGQKGSANAQYRAFLFNIRMSNTFSFSSDVKSMWANGTYGPAKADMVLESNSAVLKSGTTSTLVFPIGVNAVKRLRDSGGVNDTQFIFRDIKSDTMDANGVVTFTINTPAAGGTERLNDSVGVLSETSELDYNIVLSEDAYTANLTGTVDCTEANTLQLLGSGTAFATELAVGEFIRIPTGNSTYVRRVTSITNNTILGIDADIVDSNAAANFQQFFPDGHIVSLSTAAGAGTLEILSNTQFTVTTKLATHAGNVLDSGSQTVYAQYPVLRTTAVQSAKAINKNRFVKIDTSSHPNGAAGPWGLGLTDIHKIRNVYVDTTGASYSTSNPQRAFWFDLDSGQRDNSYEFGQLVIKPQYAGNIDTSTKILVELDHFTANTSAGIGFFSVDSYPIDDANTANTTAIQTAELPRFSSQIYGRTIELRDSIDFRPWKTNTANSTSNTSLATENPADAANGYAVPATGQYIAEPDSNFQADMEYYLPRIDLLSITKEGDLVVRKGEPEATPRTPFNEADSMALASVYIPAYPSLTTREGETFERNDIKTKIRALTNRRFTMKDIGTLEQRIKRLEYYTVLSVLEQKARDLTIPDGAGLDRFKNGIFADPFNSHSLGNVSDFEYRIAIDASAGVARPYFSTTPIDFEYNSNNSSGITRTGNFLTRPYTNETYISQRYASKIRNCTESIWKWNGGMDLYPSYDHFRDETRLPAVNIDLDFSQPWEDFAATSFAANFGSWRTVESQRSAETNGATTTTTTTRTQEQIVEGISVETMSESYNFGSYIKDVSIQPYIRSREVAFIITGLKPNTTMHAFFDDVNVDAYCAPGSVSLTTDFVVGEESRAVDRTGAFGDALVTDANGSLAGIFRIPEGQFRIGDRVFQVTNVTDLTTGANAIISSAKAVYTASSLAISSQELTLNTQQPTITSGTFTNTRVVTSSSTQTRTSFFIDTDRGGDGGGDDPIAQTFFTKRPAANISGVFATQVGLYFQSKDPTLGVTAYVVEVRNGFPDTSKIVAKAHLPSSNVNTSATAASETVFTFDNPVYLTNEKWYAILVQPDANSPEYNIWMSEVGGLDVVTSEQIFSNPYVGVAYVSANKNVWTPLQTEDIKFNLYRAKFTTGTGTAYFNNESDEFFTVDGFTRANSEIGIAIGDVVYTQNSSGDLLTTNTDPFGIVQFLDESNGKLHLNRSAGGFAANTVLEIHRPTEVGNVAAISNTSLIANATITSIDNKDYSVIVPRFGSIVPIQTTLGYSFRGMTTAYVATANVTMVGETEKEFTDQMRTIASYSNELALASNTRSGVFYVSLSTLNDYVSPVIDLRRKSVLVIENLINNDSTGESTRYGNALSRYISRSVVLADGQEAEDLQVHVSAYRPVGTDIEVYAKLLNQEDGAPFNDKVWTKMNVVDGSTYSSPIDTTDYKEYEYQMPNTAPVSQGAFVNANNSSIVEYSNAGGSRFIGYKTFALKIVLLSDNAARAPRLNDCRAIALQV